MRSRATGAKTGPGDRRDAAEYRPDGEDVHQYAHGEARAISPAKIPKAPSAMNAARYRDSRIPIKATSMPTEWRPKPGRVRPQCGSHPGIGRRDSDRCPHGHGGP